MGKDAKVRKKAQRYEEKGKYNKAIKLYEKIKDDGAIARCYEKAGNIIDAFELYAKLSDKDNTQKLRPIYVEKLKALPPSVKIAEKFERLKLFKEAAQIYESIGAFEPKLLWEYETGDSVLGVAISADGSRIVAGSDDYKVYLFNSEGELLWEYETGNIVWRVAISADRSRVVAGSDDHKIYLFNSAGELLWEYKTGDSVEGVAISADGSRIVAGSGDHKVYLFNSVGKLLWKYRTGGEVYPSVAIPADGSRIVASSLPDKIYLLGSEGELLREYETGDMLFHLGITMDGDRVVAGSDNVVAGVMAGSDDGEAGVVAGSNDGKVYLFDTFSSPSLRAIELYLLHLIGSPEELEDKALVAHIKQILKELDTKKALIGHVKQILPKVNTKPTLNTLLSESKDYATIFRICSRLGIERDAIDILIKRGEYEEALQLLDSIPASQWSQEDHLTSLSISLKLHRDDLVEERLVKIWKRGDYKSIFGGLTAEERLQVIDLLMERGHDEEALRVLTSRPETEWGMKEQLTQLKLYVRLNLTDMAEKKLSQIKQAISVDRSPEFYYEFAAFCEEVGKYRLALEVYLQFIAGNIIYKDVLDRYRHLQETIRPEGKEASGVKPRRPVVTTRGTVTGGGEEPTGLHAGKYELLRQIGSGGMGIVYEALNRQLGKKVAIKKMREEIRIRRRERERFLREARTVAELHHPNIVDIYDIIEENDEIYLVFEYIEGKTVEKILDEGSIGWEEAVQIIGDVCKALGFAHKNGVIHRDLKPSNIMVSREGYAKVMDFGIAREAKETISSVTGQRDTSGTLAYMPPEQHLGRCDIRGDIYALGVTFYEMLTGQLPFRGVDLYEQKRQMVYVPPSELGVEQPQGVDEVIKKCLEAEKEKRYPSVDEFVEEIKRIKSRDA